MQAFTNVIDALTGLFCIASPILLISMLLVPELWIIAGIGIFVMVTTPFVWVASMIERKLFPLATGKIDG